MTETNKKYRVEAFSDAVFAIAITLLILELKIPQATNPADLWHALGQLWPSLFALVFSFGAVLVMWINHHLMMNMIDRISRPFMFANGFLMLMVVMFPFITALLAQYLNTSSIQPAVVVYCAAYLLTNVAFNLLWESMKQPVYLFKKEWHKEELSKYGKPVRSGLYIYSAALIIAIWFPVIGLIINTVFWVLWIILAFSAKLE